MHVNLKKGKARVVKGSIVVFTSSRKKKKNIYLRDGEVVFREVSIATSRLDNFAMLWNQS